VLHWEDLFAGARDRYGTESPPSYGTVCVRYRPAMFCYVSQAELSVDFHGDTASDTKLHMSADCVNQLLQREAIATAVNLIRSWLTVKESEVLHLAVDALHEGLMYPDSSRHSLGPRWTRIQTAKPFVRLLCTD
jgi:hypothetical protein